ncbi:MAG TPA: MBL fold metallo-hydrolase [bacterium]|nr:MBL fold metallo-hydrolase [bacterium]
MITFSLQSGSNGNSIYVETDGIRLLFDAGISGVQAQCRLAHHGRDIQGVQAIILSHDHQDHVRCAGVCHRKFGIPIYATEPTFSSARRFLGKVKHVEHFRSGDTIHFNGVCVHSIPTPHDGVDGVCFVVESKGKRLGVFTDLGHPFRSLREWFPELDAAYLESNYDPDMLEIGRYPEYLKHRIRGEAGHLSNGEAADLVERFASPRLKWLALSHLSEENNTPQLAERETRKVVGKAFPLHVASRYSVGSLLTV